MTIDVRIPTILRPYTKDQKSVQASGSNLGALIADLDQSYAGIGERLLEDGALRRFINVYINDEDVDIELDGKVQISNKMGYISSVEDARKTLESIFRKDLKDNKES